MKDITVERRSIDDEVQSRFVSVAARELRTPLTTIVGYLEMLLDEEFGPLTVDQREPLKVMSESAQHLRSVTNNLLDATRIDTGRVELALRPTDLPALVQATAVEFRPQLEAKAQHLTLNTSPGLPPALCDERRAMQVTGILLSSASKLTPRGGQISVSVTLAGEEGFLEIAMTDTTAVFLAEGQAKTVCRPPLGASAGLAGIDGAGLELHIARSLVELHGGVIGFESDLGKDSRLRVTFPIAEGPVAT